MSKDKIIVVGAGPVGALAALYAAQRGYTVELYELRGDIRDSSTTPLNFTKSINLALSERGINALRSSNHPTLLNDVLDTTLPMHGRMVHTRNKTTGQMTHDSQPYDVHGRYQRSVDRGKLNILILDALSTFPNVTLHFHHKLTGADFRARKAWFEQRLPSSTSSDSNTRAPEIEVSFSLLLGADGAHSAVRHHMMKSTLMDFSQTYIDCLWCEFTMAPKNPDTSSSSSGPDFQISPSHLHIWPGGTFMFIALPNTDKSFTCTFFGPVRLFTHLTSSPDSTITSFFNTSLPGVTDHISPPELISQFRSNPHLPLINIKASPHHYSSSVAILGDAANAIVPFYGQGMNCGLESVRILFETLDAHHNDHTTALDEYTKSRVPNTHAIADLALQNYHEMSSGVTSPLYKMRKYIEESLDRYLPSLGWATQYSRVSFGNMPYREVVERSRRQKRILMWLGALVGAMLGVGVGGGVWWLVGLRYWRRLRVAR
jgi:kynurenine 3-monooxygenase